MLKNTMKNQKYKIYVCVKKISIENRVPNLIILRTKPATCVSYLQVQEVH